MKKWKIFLSEKEINEDITRSNELLANKIIVEKTIPDYWAKGFSDYSWNVNLLLAIFFGIFASDRFYLGKILSGTIKLVISVIITPFFIWLCTAYNSFSSGHDAIFVFASLFFMGFLGFYIGDIIIAIVKPRDHLFRLIIRKKH